MLWAVAISLWKISELASADVVSSLRILLLLAEQHTVLRCHHNNQHQILLSWSNDNGKKCQFYFNVTNCDAVCRIHSGYDSTLLSTPWGILTFIFDYLGTCKWQELPEDFSLFSFLLYILWDPLPPPPTVSPELQACCHTTDFLCDPCKGASEELNAAEFGAFLSTCSQRLKHADANRQHSSHKNSKTDEMLCHSIFLSL